MSSLALEAFKAVVAVTVGYLAKPILQLFTDYVVYPLNPFRERELIDLHGTWQTHFTWEPNDGQETSSEDTIDVKKWGRSIWGKSLTGKYKYTFRARLVAGHIVIGQWQSARSPFIGTFQLELKFVEGPGVLDGYWLGNGGGVVYHGTWNWRKP